MEEKNPFSRSNRLGRELVSIPSKGPKPVLKSASRVAERVDATALAVAPRPTPVSAAATTQRRRATPRRPPPPAQLSHLADEIERVREEERTATARDIHDDIGGALAALKLRYAKLVRDLRDGDDETLRVGMLELGTLIDAAVSATQGVMRALRPSALQLGLVAALESATSDFSLRTGVRCRFTTNHDGAELPAAQSTAIYRVCQEALTNVAKHARATLVEVELFRDRSKVTLEITDNGVGLDTADLAKRDSFGVRGMRERAESFGGWVDLSGRPGGGTTVMLQIPLRRVQDTVR